MLSPPPPQLLWLAEEKSLMSNPLRPARGTVIEANLDKKKGPIATLLVQVGRGATAVLTSFACVLCVTIPTTNALSLCPAYCTS